MKLQWVLSAYCKNHGILGRDEDGSAYCPDCETEPEQYVTAEEIRLRELNKELVGALKLLANQCLDIEKASHAIFKDLQTQGAHSSTTGAFAASMTILEVQARAALTRAESHNSPKEN